MSHYTPYFVVEGNIGAGKSTFLHLVQHYLDVQLVFEPHHKWQNVAGENVLDYFYSDMQRWAYTFQSLAFITRIQEQEEHARRNDRPAQIVERSVFSDRYCFAQNCYEMGIMSLLEWNLYRQWFSWLVNEHMQRPAGCIYLRTSPEVCYDRLRKRNRKEEANVSYDYLKLLHDKHEAWLIDKEGIEDHVADIPVVTISCDEDFEHDISAQKKCMHDVAAFIEQRFHIPVLQNMQMGARIE